MSMMTGDIGHRSLHDQIVLLVVQNWAKTLYYKVTVNIPEEQTRWEESEKQQPDIIGWRQDGAHTAMEWIAEVETEETFSEADLQERWRRYVELRLPFFVFVPRGFRPTTQAFASRFGLYLSGIYEYDFVNEKFQVG
jgi:hypothetical protein